MNDRRKLRIDPNMIGLAIVVIAFFVSLVVVLKKPVDDRGAVVDESRVVRFLHWQLEPGFREGLQAVIDDYNRLPHVREAGYRVEQMAVTEKVYAQFLNVHLISGTAPDLMVRGKASLSSQAAQFFEPLGEYIERPNPYNVPESMPDDFDPEFVKFMSTAPWRETFLDGMASNYDPSLGYYFSVPVASWGPVRMYFNTRLMAEAKALIREALAADELPEWIRPVFFDRAGGRGDGFLELTQDVRAWAADASPPDTFGRLVLVCEAVREYARINGLDKLVPIGGSSYSQDMFVTGYNASFAYAYEDRLDSNDDARYSPTEIYGGWQRGVWSFGDERIAAFYELLDVISGYFPPGFLGLDREQANRRFILGNAAMLATGAWDASGIFIGAQQHADPARRFEVGVIDFPMPGPGERFSEYKPMVRSEGSGFGGIPVVLNKFSPMKEESIDFLKYLTSYSANSKLVRIAGFLPTVVGAEVADRMRPFMGRHEGIPSGLAILFTDSMMKTIYEGRFLLYLAGDIDYAGFREQMETAFRDPRTGLDRQWYEHARQSRESNRGVERSLGVQLFDRLRSGDAASVDNRYTKVLQRSGEGLSGRAVEREFKQMFPERSFPEY